MDFAVVPDDPSLQASDDAWSHVIGALNIQVSQQAAPVWAKQGTVTGYARAELVPATAVPVVVMKSPANGIEGCHKWQDEKPSAVVRWQANGAWSVAASHEIIETLVDPTLGALRKGPDPLEESETVDFLVEVCDPCVGVTYAVTPGSQIQVTDFCLPAYYAQGGYGPYTRCGQSLSLWTPNALVSDSGYLTWSKPDGWRQLFNGSVLGPHTKEELLANSLRSGVRGAVDRFAHFGKPPHLRQSRRHATAARRTDSNRFAANTRLAAWISHLAGSGPANASFKRPPRGTRRR